MALFACWIGFFLLFLGDSAGSTALACAAAVLLILSSVGAGVCAARRSARDNAAAANAALGSSNATTKPFAQSDLLTDRELSIAGLVRSGMSSSQVADKLHIGSSTVRSSLQRIYRKLGIDGIEDLRSLAEDAGSGLDAADKGASSECPPFIWPLAEICAAIALFCSAGLSPFCLVAFPSVESFAGTALGIFAAGITGTWPRRLKANRKVATLLLLVVFLAVASCVVVICVRSCNELSRYYSNLQNSYAYDVDASATLIAYLLFSHTASLFALMALEDLGHATTVDAKVWTTCLFVVASAVVISTISLVLWAVTMIATAVLLVAARIRSDAVVPAVTAHDPLSGDAFLCPPQAASIAAFAIAVVLACPCLASMGAADAFALLFFLSAAASSVLMAAKSGFLRATVGPASIASLLLHTTLCVSAMQLNAFEPLFQTQPHCAAFMVLLPYGLLGLARPEVRGRHSVSSIRRLFLWFAAGTLASVLAMRLPLCLRASFKLDAPDALYDGLSAAGFVLFGLVAISAGALLLWDACKAPVSHRTSPQVLGNRGAETLVQLFMSCNLNETESLVLDGIARGLSGREIAQELSYSLGTVNSARQKGYRQLHVHSAKELAEFVSSHGV